MKHSMNGEFKLVLGKTILNMGCPPEQAGGNARFYGIT